MHGLDAKKLISTQPWLFFQITLNLIFQNTCFSKKVNKSILNYFYAQKLCQLLYIDQHLNSKILVLVTRDNSIKVTQMKFSDLIANISI